MIRTLLLLLACTIAVVTAIVPIVPITHVTPSSLPLGSNMIIRGDMVSTSSSLTPCDHSDSTTINATDGSVGCQGVTAKQTVSWTFSSDKTRQLNIAIGGYDGTYVTITYNNYVISTLVPGQKTQLTFPAGGVGVLSFYTGPYTVGSYGVFIDFVSVATPQAVVSGQTYNLQKEQQGGFVYFALPWYAYGKLFSLDVKVYSYQGLQEPSVYVSVGNLPTLEKYDFTNSTVTVAGVEQCVLYKADPTQGVYFIGVFLYGSTARISVNAQWTFNFRPMTSGVKVTSSTNSTIQYYQVNVPVNAASLKFQISRQVPGGYPIAYLTQGTLASQWNYQWIADTATQSYISITIANPNPAGSGAANPGNYIVGVQAAAQSGFIIQFDWQ